MAEIFISYSHEDKAKAAAMAQALEASGATVWWDNDLLPGARFAATLAERIDKASAVVVMWSATSIASDYVCDEADRARIANRLTPVLIEQVRPPVGFGQLHTHDLTTWSGAPDDPVLLDFIARLALMNEPGDAQSRRMAPAPKAPAPAPRPGARGRRLPWLAAAAVCTGLLVGAGWLIGQSGIPVAARAEDNAAACMRLAGSTVDWDTLEGQAAEAVEACEAAVAAAPSPKLNYLLGRAYDTGGDFDGAVRNYTIAANGGDLSALDSLCETLAYDKLPEAREWCQKALDAGIVSARKHLNSLN